jgi:hypothetical protein
VANVLHHKHKLQSSPWVDVFKGHALIATGDITRTKATTFPGIPPSPVLLVSVTIQTQHSSLWRHNDSHLPVITKPSLRLIPVCWLDKYNWEKRDQLTEYRYETSNLYAGFKAPILFQFCI